MLPGMKFAVIARPPVVGGKVASLDASAAMKVPGVEKMVTIAPHAGAGEVRSARRRRRDRQEHLGGAQGPRGAQDHLGRRAQQGLRLQGLQGAARRRPCSKPGKVERNEGDAEKALASAAKVITAEYYAPHLAPRDHGAAGGDGAHEPTASGRCGRRCRAPAARATTSPSALGIKPEET